MAFQGEGERERQNLETPKAGELQDWSVVRPGTQAETPPANPWVGGGGVFPNSSCFLLQSLLASTPW